MSFRKVPHVQSIVAEVENAPHVPGNLCQETLRIVAEVGLVPNRSGVRWPNQRKPVRLLRTFDSLLSCSLSDIPSSNRLITLQFRPHLKIDRSKNLSARVCHVSG